MPDGALDEDGDPTIVCALHSEGDCRGRGRTMQTGADATAGFAAALFGGLVRVGRLRRMRLGAGLHVASARRGVLADRGDNLIHSRRGRGRVRHGMRELAEDELTHQQENHGPAMEMESRHSCSVAATRRPCNRQELQLPDTPYTRM